MFNETISRIDKIVSRINTHPEYSSCVATETSRSLRLEAEKHSLDIELIGEKKRLTKKQKKNFLNNLDEAWGLLRREGISRFSLSQLGPIVEPKNNPTGSFRNLQTSFGGFFPTEQESIPYEIESLIYFLESSKTHPVVRASNAHLEMVRIHPYNDGNGRAARLLQNFCLMQRGYPPAIMPSKERKDYIQMMGNVLRGRYNLETDLENQSEAEIEFHNFIASKVLSSALILEKELKSRRMYEINLSHVADPSTPRSLAYRIRKIGRNSQGVRSGISVKILQNGNKKSCKLEVMGDVGSEELDKAISQVSEKRKFKHSLDKKHF